MGIPQCVLCQKKEANKTGAHVIPYFLLKSMLIPSGAKRASGKEFSFTIGALETQAYAGRGLPAEDVSRLIGSNVDIDGLAQKDDPHVVDNVWCNECENLFGAVENYYSERQEFSGTDGVLRNNCESAVATLFWASIYWRIEITNYAGGTSFSDEEIGSLRRLLLELLPLMDKVDSLGKLLIEDQILSTPFKHSLFLSPKEEDIAMVIYDHDSHNPCLLLVNGRIVFFNCSSTARVDIQSTSDLLDVKSFVEKAVSNPNERKFEVAVLLSKSEASKITRGAFRIQAKKWKEDTKWLTDQLFQKFFHQDTPDKLFQIIVNDVAFGDEGITIAERYTNKRLLSIIAKHIHQYFLNQSRK